MSTIGEMATSDTTMIALFMAIADGDDDRVLHQLNVSPDLATRALVRGATRENSDDFFFDSIRHGVYAGDTALHVAAAAYRLRVVETLLSLGASARATNRRGAEPLHYAVDGIPGAPAWNPRAQALVITALLSAGADANAPDKGGVTPLHRAVRNRCAAAVRVLLERGADPRKKNKGGSTPKDLATQTTGRGGSGSAEAKEQQREIVQLFAKSFDHFLEPS